MKKVFLSIVLLGVITMLNAQKVKFGVKAGLNIANVTGSDADGNKALASFYGGGLVNIPVTTNGLSVQPELVYSGQGAKESGGGDAKVNLGYLNIPVLAKYTFNGGFFAETGPQLGFLLNAKAKSSGVSVDVKDSFKSTDFSWGFGIGYQSSMGIGAGVRYNYGISKLDKEGDAKVYNGVIQIGVHYLFAGGHK